MTRYYKTERGFRAALRRALETWGPERVSWVALDYGWELTQPSKA